MNAQKLAYRNAMSSLIEFDLESAAPEQLPALADEIIVTELAVEHIDLDLLAGDDDLDLLQLDEESSFFNEINMSRDRRAARRLFRDAT